MFHQVSLTCFWNVVIQNVIFMLRMPTVFSSSQSGHNVVTDCNPERLSQCVPQMQGFLDNNAMVFAISEEELDSICQSVYSTFNSEIECLESYIDMCFSPENRNAYDRMREESKGIIDDLCSKGLYRIEYLRHAQCLNGSSSNLQHCVGSYRLLVKESLSGVNPVNADAADAEKVSLVKFCCAYSDFVTCVYDKVLQFCDQETISFFKDFTYRSTVPFFQGHCTNYTVGSRFCSSSSSFLGSFMTFSLIIILLVLSSSHSSNWLAA